jgi:hypothetical protein
VGRALEPGGALAVDEGDGVAVGEVLSLGKMGMRVGMPEALPVGVGVGVAGGVPEGEPVGVGVGVGGAVGEEADVGVPELVHVGVLVPEPAWSGLGQEDAPV